MLAGAFSDSVLTIADWVKLIGDFVEDYFRRLRSCFCLICVRSCVLVSAARGLTGKTGSGLRGRGQTTASTAKDTMSKRQWLRRRPVRKVHNSLQAVSTYRFRSVEAEGAGGTGKGSALRANRRSFDCASRDKAARSSAQDDRFYININQIYLHSI